MKFVLVVIIYGWSQIGYTLKYLINNIKTLIQFLYRQELLAGKTNIKRKFTMEAIV